MADLKPLGSEKLEGQEKISRILEIANYGSKPSTVNESKSSSADYTIQLADGNFYGIVKEKSGYIVKKGINESELDYIEPMKNRKYHKSYSQAMKKINLMAGELNRLHENVEGINLIGEQKKFVLKTPKPAEPEVDASVEMDVPAPAPDAAPEGGEDMSMDAAPEGGEEMDLDLDMGMETPEGGEEMDLDMDMEAPEGDDDEEMSFKTIQKLTGKLGQKLRTFESSQGLSSENIKYVLNSVLSALDLSKLTEEDYDDIMAKFEEDEDEIDYGVDDEADIDVDADDDMMDLDMDIESDVEPEMGEMTEDHYEGHDEDYDDMFLSAYADDDKERTWYNRGDRQYKGDFSDIEFDEIPVSSLKGLLDVIKGKKQKWFATNKDSDAREFGLTGDGEEMFKRYSEKGPLTLRVKRPVNASYDSALDEIFSESKIEKVLSKYFVVSQEEQK